MSDPRTAAPPPSPRSAPPRAATSAQPARKPMQFSMRTLLIVVTIVAVVAALLPYAGVSLLTALLVAVFILIKFVPLICLGTLAIYCRGYRQTLCLGAFAATLLQALAGGDIYARFIGGYTLVGQIVVAAMQLATAIGCGFAAVATRRFLERRGWHLPASHNDSV